MKPKPEKNNNKKQQNSKLSSKFPQKLFDLIKKIQSVKPLKILDSILKGS